MRVSSLGGSSASGSVGGIGGFADKFLMFGTASWAGEAWGRWDAGQASGWEVAGKSAVATGLLIDNGILIGRGLLTGAARLAGRGASAAAEEGATQIPRLFWHGSRIGVRLRQTFEFTNFISRPGGAVWASRLAEVNPLTRGLVGGGYDLVKAFPFLAKKPAIEAAYELTAEQAGLFRRAWGPEFSYNPYVWWKGAAGQYYLYTIPTTAAQRLGELAWGAGLTASIPATALLANKIYDKWMRSQRSGNNCD